MADIREAEPVRLIVGMLSAFDDALAEAELRLADLWGPIGLRSPIMPHEFTDYYRRQMGHPLKRRFVDFERLIDPGDLAAIKRQTNAVERDLGAAGRWPVERPVNLDPGTIGPAKLVLASCKDYTHRVYLGDGIYAEPTLGYADGRWVCYDWTYPDYRTAEYHAFFSAVRERLMACRKEKRHR